MSIYVFSLLIGYELSGVDFAQGRRISYLCKRGIPVKHVFTSIPELKHIEHYINCGIQPEQMISLQLKMFGVDNLAGDFLVERNLTQVAFAKIIGVKQSQVSEWLKGKAKPGYDTLKNMSVAFNVSADFFLGLKDY